MTKKVTILIAAVLVFVSIRLLAEPGARDRDMVKHARFGIHMAEKNLFPGHMLLKFKDEIGLTAEQVSKIEKMKDLFQEATVKKQADIKVKGLKIRSYLTEEQVDRKKMEIMIREIAKMRTDLQVDHMNYLLDMRMKKKEYVREGRPDNKKF